jgi:hypothetical protein
MVRPAPERACANRHQPPGHDRSRLRGRHSEGELPALRALSTTLASSQEGRTPVLTNTGAFTPRVATDHVATAANGMCLSWVIGPASRRTAVHLKQSTT